MTRSEEAVPSPSPAAPAGPLAALARPAHLAQQLALAVRHLRLQPLDELPRLVQLPLQPAAPLHSRLARRGLTSSRRALGHARLAGAPAGGERGGRPAAVGPHPGSSARLGNAGCSRRHHAGKGCKTTRSWRAPPAGHGGHPPALQLIQLPPRIRRRLGHGLAAREELPVGGKAGCVVSERRLDQLGAQVLRGVGVGVGGATAGGGCTTNPTAAGCQLLTRAMLARRAGLEGSGRGAEWWLPGSLWPQPPAPCSRQGGQARGCGSVASLPGSAPPCIWRRAGAPPAPTSRQGSTRGGRALSGRAWCWDRICEKMSLRGDREEHSSWGELSSTSHTERREGVDTPDHPRKLGLTRRTLPASPPCRARAPQTPPPPAARWATGRVRLVSWWGGPRRGRARLDAAPAGRRGGGGSQRLGSRGCGMKQCCLWRRAGVQHPPARQ